MVDPGMIAELIDLSRHNGDVNMALVAAAGKIGLIQRNSVGNYYSDPKRNINYDAALASGMLASKYHVDRPDNTTISQINRLAEANDARRVSFPWVLDVEVVRPSPGEPNFDPDLIARSAWEMFQAIRDYDAGRDPMVYTAQWVVNGYIRRSDGTLPPDWRQLSNTAELFVADYTDPINYPAEWTTQRMRQHTNRGRVDGISGNVDLDSFYNDQGELGTVAELYEWAEIELDPPPVPTVRFARVITGRLNVRTGPGTNNPVIGQLYRNAVPAVIADSQVPGEWWVQIGENLWSALFYRGSQLMEWVSPPPPSSSGITFPREFPISFGE